MAAPETAAVVTQQGSSSRDAAGQQQRQQPLKSHSLVFLCYMTTQQDN
jgi:hypothetical protein